MESVFFKIVLPNYNTKPYINECLFSIIDQSFQDFKLIIIDDLSTDGSDIICKNYQEKYPNKIIFIKADKKSYAGGCRNIGIKYPIESKYTIFIDGDDFFTAKNSLKHLYSNIKDSDYDVITYSYYTLFGKNKRQVNFISYDAIIKANRLINSQYNAVWCRAVKSSIIPLCLENCMYGEDTFTWVKLYKKDLKIKQLQEPIYTYRVLSSSVSHNKSSFHIKSKTVFINELQKVFFDKNTDSILKNQIKNQIFKREMLNKLEKVPDVRDYYETLNELINTNKSFIRFGDGEYSLLNNNGNVFEKKLDTKYVDILKEIIQNKNENIMVGIPKCYFYDYPIQIKNLTDWINNIIHKKFLNVIFNNTNINSIYYDSYTTILLSQITFDSVDINLYISRIKQIFKDKDVLLVTGDDRIANWTYDIFELSKSFETLIYNSKNNSFNLYDTIKNDILCHDKNKVCVMVFGPVGKILAYDLAVNNNIRSLDFGHFFKIYSLYKENKLQNIDRNLLWKD